MFTFSLPFIGLTASTDEEEESMQVEAQKSGQKKTKANQKKVVKKSKKELIGKHFEYRDILSLDS